MSWIRHIAWNSTDTRYPALSELVVQFKLPHISPDHMDANRIHQNLSAVAETQKKKYPGVIKHESVGAGSLAWPWACHSNFENKALKYQSLNGGGDSCPFAEGERIWGIYKKNQKGLAHKLSKRIREWDPFVQGVQWPLIVESVLYRLLHLHIWRG